MNIQQKHPAVFASFVGVLFCILLESSQIIIQSRAASIYDMSIMIAGCLCGVIYTITSSRSLTSRRNSHIIIIMTAATAAVYSLTPFQISSSYNKMSLIPFLPYYEQTSFNALSNFIETVLIYFPMGCIFAAFHINKEEALITSGITAFLIAMPLELLQGWIVGRYPDITNVIGAIGGAVIGGLIWINGLTAWKKNLMYENS